MPQFTLVERERRWGRVRQLMGAQDLSLLLAPPHSGHWGQAQADMRYLTQLGINMYECFAVFPVDAEVVALTRLEGHAAWLRSTYGWIEDLRPVGDKPWHELVVARMRELGYTERSRERVGVAGFSGGDAGAEGVMRSDTMHGLMEAFPIVQWVPASDLMLEARRVKSAEEIGFLERAGQIADRAVQAMIEHARPGMPAQQLWAHMHAAMLQAGGEYPSMINWDIRPDVGFWPRHPTYRTIQPGDSCVNEIDAKVNGYIHQTNHPLYIGQAPEAYRRAAAAVLDAFEAAREAGKAGSTVGDMGRAAERAFARHGVKGQFMLHGRGLGDDLPALAQGKPEDDQVVLEEGVAFILKPAVVDAGASGYQYRVAIGDSCVIERGGARRLSAHRMELTEIQP